MSRLVVALGGNALGKSPSEQLERINVAAPFLVDLIEEGHEIVITHGNGPQVGQISLAMEYSHSNSNETPYMPFAECGSMSQGYIGYQLQQCLQEEMRRRGVNKDCLTIVTQTLVDKNDSAFENPTKPIGLFYTKEEASMISDEKGYIFIEDSGRGYRRVVPSPRPIDIIEKDAIIENLEADNIVIAAGGGGIPVINENGDLKGVDAVVDKDLSSSLLAKEIGADILLILTTVDKVCLNYNTENQVSVDNLSVDEVLKYIEEGQFAKGSMLPKVEACLEFVKDSGSKAIITSLQKASDALSGSAGTLINGGE